MRNAKVILTARDRLVAVVQKDSALKISFARVTKRLVTTAIRIANASQGFVTFKVRFPAKPTDARDLLTTSKIISYLSTL